METEQNAASRGTKVQGAIAVLVYANLDKAHAHLVDAFGLGPGHISRDDDGRAVHAELDAGRGVVWLHGESEQFGLTSPAKAGAATCSVAVMVSDVGGHHRHARDRGALIEYEPVDQPYGNREYSARDTEGGLWSFMAAL